MNTIILPRQESNSTLDRPLKWGTACLLLLSFAVAVGVTVEIAVNGIGEAEARHFVSQVRSISSWSTVLLEFAQNHSTMTGAQ